MHRCGRRARVLRNPCSHHAAEYDAHEGGAGVTPAQVNTARSIYAGVVNQRTGEPVFPGSAPGGEPQWAAYAPGVFPIAVNYWRDQVTGDPNWSPATLDVDKD